MNYSILKINLSLLVFLFCLNNGFGQFGINVYQNKGSYPKWDTAAKSQLKEDIGSTQYELGVHYWFRLKKRRIEFLPEIFVSKANTITDIQDDALKMSTVGFRFNTRFYVMDLGEDCNCPTFSKGGTFMKKGFFLSLAPQIALNRLTDIEATNSTTSFAGRMGAGIDIGISDFLTVTPSVHFLVGTAGKWKSAHYTIEATSTNYSMVQLGLGVGFRFDQTGRRYR